MKHVVSLLFFASLIAAWPQQQPPAQPIPAPGAPWLKPTGKPLPPDKLLARVNGEPITVGKLNDLLSGAPQLALNSAAADPGEFLTWTYLLSQMSADAEKQGLGKKPPYADRMEWNRAQVLMMARLEDKNREATPDKKEVEQLYRDNPHRYGVAKTKLIYVASQPGRETQAKALMDAVAANARNGADFVKLVKQYSSDQDSAAKDGDFPDITPASRLPEAIRKTIFTTKPGELTPVFTQPAGFYLFKLMAVGMRPLEEIAQETRNAASQQRGGEWMAEEKKKAAVKILHQDFFDSLKITAGAMVSRGADNINLQASPKTAEIKPNTPLAEINGRVMNADEYTNLIKAVSPQIRTKAIVAPIDFLKDYAFMQHLAGDSIRLGLDRIAPYRNRLIYDRDMTLMQAAVDEYLNNIVVTVEEQKAGYAADPDKFRYANVRVLYVAYSLTPPPQADPNAAKVLNENEASAKVDGILQELREKKGDFALYVQKYSEDEASKNEGGIMRPIAFLDPQVPGHIKQAIFAGKAGDIVGPVKMPNGYYLFKVDAIALRNYGEVKDQIYEELRQQRFQDWFNAQRAAFKVTVEDLDGFRNTVAHARP
jgi:parvulin-like peptidyl-prolyl isomerase